MIHARVLCCSTDSRLPARLAEILPNHEVVGCASLKDWREYLMPEVYGRLAEKVITRQLPKGRSVGTYWRWGDFRTLRMPNGVPMSIDDDHMPSEIRHLVRRTLARFSVSAFDVAILDLPTCPPVSKDEVGSEGVDAFYQVLVDSGTRHLIVLSHATDESQRVSKFVARQEVRPICRIQHLSNGYCPSAEFIGRVSLSVQKALIRL